MTPGWGLLGEILLYRDRSSHGTQGGPPLCYKANYVMIQKIGEDQKDPNRCLLWGLANRIRVIRLPWQYINPMTKGHQ
jgi:hypothetical protein